MLPCTIASRQAAVDSETPSVRDFTFSFTWDPSYFSGYAHLRTCCAGKFSTAWPRVRYSADNVLLRGIKTRRVNDSISNCTVLARIVLYIVRHGANYLPAGVSSGIKLARELAKALP